MPSDKAAEYYQLVSENTKAMNGMHEMLLDQKGIMTGVRDALVGLGAVVSEVTAVGKDLARQTEITKSLADQCHERHHRVMGDIKEIKKSISTSNCAAHAIRLDALDEKIDVDREADKHKNSTAWGVATGVFTAILAGVAGYLIK